MRIGIIAAMEKEVKYFKSMMDDLKEVKKQHLTFYVGKINNNEIILVVSGIGKVSSGIIVATMVNTFDNIDRIINVGVSGGNARYVERGDVVIGVNYSYADVDCRALDDYPFGRIFGFPKMFDCDQLMLDLVKNKGKLSNFKLGTILTGDKFFIDDNEINQINDLYFSDYQAMAFDMESTALAQAAYCYQIPFIAIRAISDVIGVENQSDVYYDYVEIACKKANDILLLLLESF